MNYRQTYTFCDGARSKGVCLKLQLHFTLMDAIIWDESSHLKHGRSQAVLSSIIKAQYSSFHDGSLCNLITIFVQHEKTAPKGRLLRFPHSKTKECNLVELRSIQRRPSVRAAQAEQEMENNENPKI